MKKYLTVLTFALLLLILGCRGKQVKIDEHKPDKTTNNKTNNTTTPEPEAELPANPPKLTDELLNLLTTDLKEKLEARKIKTVAIFNYYANYSVPVNWVGDEVKQQSGIYIDEPGKAVVNFLRKFVINKTSCTETEREHIDKIVEELGKNLDGKFEATAEKLGNLKIADAFIFPQIQATFKDGGYAGNPAETLDYKHKLIASYSITAKMVDVTTREVFWIGEIPCWGYECAIVKK